MGQHSTTMSFSNLDLNTADTATLFDSNEYQRQLQNLRSEAGAIQDRIEFEIETRWSPKAVKRFLTTLGPLLLVITFLEDGFRVLFRWSEQMNYLTGDRHGMGMSRWFAVLALLTSVFLQIGGSALILQGKRAAFLKGQHVKVGGGALLTFLFLQPVMYGQHADVDFMCRTLTLAGGLALLWQHDMETQGTKVDLFAGLPDTRSQYTQEVIQLTGRTLMTLMFFYQMFEFLAKAHAGVLHYIGALLTCLICSTVLLGFKAKTGAVLLIALLAIGNVLMHPFWSVRPHLYDFTKFYFFQTLSMIGGLMLLVLHGPGGLSVGGDSKKLI